jgi:5-methyltetrahydropteroyltriglutamate--homocysteine methyltransferase
MNHPISIPLLPTTMVGSYPRPEWLTQQLHGRDLLDAFKDRRHEEAFRDAVRVVIGDQERAGLDLVTDGQMWFDDYSMGIGSFLWYWFERIEGFDPARLPHPARSRAKGMDVPMLDEAGGVAVIGPVKRTKPLRLVDLFKIATDAASRPVKCCVGAGPVQLSAMCHLERSPYQHYRDVALALAEVFNAEIRDLVAAGAKHIQLEDLGAWVPNLTGPEEAKWINEVVRRTLDGVDRSQVRIGWHFCLGNTWGNVAHGFTKGGYGNILHHYLEAPVHEYVLDFACRDMCDVDVLKQLPRDKSIAAGVIDVRTLEVEAPEQVAARIRKVLEHVPPERVVLTTDCGMKQLPRYCAFHKLRSLAAGARMVREEIRG